MAIFIRCFIVACLGMPLFSCTAPASSHVWDHPRNPGAVQLLRDLDECRFYAGITATRAFGAERPVDMQEWDPEVQECMARRGWHYHAR